jgi:hypothetical protein
MTTQEFSNEFDTLLNSYSTVPPYGDENKLDITLDEYEKSVFLTKAQEEIVVESYTGKNQFGESFERTEEIRRYLSDLVKTVVLSDKLTGHVGLSKTSMFFQLPEDVWFITYESATLKDERLGCLDGEEATIVPVTQDEYYRIAKNPFRGPSKGRAVRLDIGDGVIEIISDYNIDKYLVRYLSRPKPIVLVDLSELSVNGIKVRTECELNPVIHRAILERAVRLAIISKTQVSGSK